MHYIAVFTTVDSRDMAEQIGRHLVEHRLAACVQIEAVSSIYHWQGQLQQDQEFRLLCKTTSACYGAVESTIKRIHPYQLPAIYALPFSHIDPVFAAWLAEQTRAKS